jgi:hypothetical protein
MAAILRGRDEDALKRRLSRVDGREASLRCEQSIRQGGIVSAQTKLRRTLALALAGGSLAIGVPAALAAGGGSDAGSSGSGAPATRFVQDEQQPDDQNRPDHDCPERDGGGSGSGSSDSGTSTPEV